MHYDRDNGQQANQGRNSPFHSGFDCRKAREIAQEKSERRPVQHPTSKFQAPEKLQSPNSIYETRGWKFRFGVSLDLNVGIWWFRTRPAAKITALHQSATPIDYDYEQEHDYERRDCHAQYRYGFDNWNASWTSCRRGFAFASTRTSTTSKRKGISGLSSMRSQASAPREMRRC
jgi:hypothetical protein